MNRDAAAAYVEQALAALKRCRTDAALKKWEDSWTSSSQYLNLPEDLARRLEQAFQKRLEWIMGEGVE